MALLKFKRSAVPAKIPSIADLALGELAINTYDGKVYTKKDDGTQAIVEVGGGGGVQTITSSDGSVTVTGTTDINLSVPVTAATNTVILPVRNNSGATLAKGTAVYINGALGQNPTVTKAIATGDATSAQTLGLVTANIANNTVGNVTLIGTLTNVDTSAFSDGQQLYLSPTTAGALTATKPYAPNHLVYMAVVEHAHPSLGKLFVKVQNGYEMDELHDVSAQNPANNDGLFYNTTSGLWEKKSIVTALGYTPVNRAGDTMTGQLSITGAGNVNGGNLQLGDKAEGTNKWSVMTGAHYNGVSQAKGVMLIGSYSNSEANQVIIGGNVWEANPATQIVFYTSPTTTHATGGLSRLSIDGNGSVTASVDIRAPIFYDTPNTAYFLDPSNTSNFVGLTVANTITGSVSGTSGSISGFNNPTTAPTANTIVYRDSIGDIAAREIVLSSSLSTATPTVLVSMFPTTNQLVRTTPAAVATAIQGAASGSWGISVTGTAAKATDLNQARYVNTDFNTLGTSPQVFRAYSNYIPSGGSYNQPVAGGNDFKVIQWGDVDGGTSGNWGGQIVQNFYDDRMWFRRSYGTTWQAWREFIHDGNYTSYAMPIGSLATNTVEIRAPIFKDNNNTAYYLDPAEISKTWRMGANYFQSNDDVATDTPFGIYFSNNLNTDYAIYRESGAWNSPYPDLRIGFYTGIKMGAEATYGGMRFYNSSSMATQVMSINNSADGVGANNVFINNVLVAAGDIRAPVFYDYNNTGYYVDPASTSNLNRLTAAGRSMVCSAQISMSGLDANTWYPVTIPIPVARQTTLRIENALNSNAPSWSTHPAGFSCYFEWTANGLGWGTIGLSRRITDWREQYASVQIVGGIDQMTFSSQEVIWLRGGANYFFSADCDVTPTIRTTTYDAYGQTVAPRSTVYNDPWSTAVGKMSYGTFQATGSTSLRTVGDWRSDSSAWTGEFAGKIQYHNNSWYLQASGAWVFRDGAGGEPFVCTQGGIASATGELRAPIFRDSNDAAFYLDPNGTSILQTVSSGLQTWRGDITWNNGVNIFVPASAECSFDVATSGVWQVWDTTTGAPMIKAPAGSNVQIGEAGSRGLYVYGGITASANITANGSLNAPIYRDSSNTGYYWNFADGAVSYINTQIIGLVYYKCTFGNNIYSGAVNNPPLQVYSEDGGTAMFSFHRAGVYAVNMGLDPDNVLRIGGWSASANRFQMDMSGNLTMAGNVTAYSDARLKENVSTVADALDLVNKMRGVTYTRKDTGEAGVGVIAQEMLEVLPEVVQQGIGDDDTLSVAYGNLVGVLIEAVKELSLKVKTLEEKDN